MKEPPTPKELAEMITADSDFGRTAASFYLTDAFDRHARLQANPESKESLKQFEKDELKKCVKYGKMEKSTCEHAFNNGVWQICQEMKKPRKFCKDYSYSASAKDVFTSPYFWGGLGAILGILMVTVAFLVVYCVCLKKKKNKGMTGGNKNGKGKMFKGSGSQETPMTPGTGSKSLIINGNGNNQKSPGGRFGNGKKYQQGVNPNQETYMY